MAACRGHATWMGLAGLRRAVLFGAAGLIVVGGTPAARADELVARIEARELGGAAMTFLVFGPERGQLMCYVDGWSLWFGLYLACDGCVLEAPECVLLSELDAAAVGGMRDKRGIDLPYAAFGDTRVVFDGFSGGALLDLCRSFAATLVKSDDPAALCIEPARYRLFRSIETDRIYQPATAGRRPFGESMRGD